MLHGADRYFLQVDPMHLLVLVVRSSVCIHLVGINAVILWKNM